MKGYYKRRNCECDDPKKCSCGKTWTYWVDIGPDPKTGERRQISKGGFKTKKDAEDAVAALITDVKQGTFIKESKILFKDFAEQWLPMYIDRTCPKPGTIRLRKYGIKKLLPYLAHIKLKNVSEEMFQEALDDLKANNLAKSTLEGILATGKMIFDMAVHKKLIREDPTKKVYIKKDPKVINETDDEKNQDEDLPNYFEKDELKVFLDAAKKYGLFMDVLIFTLLAYTGMRVGELVVLKWKDIDFTKRTVRINKTYYNEYNNIAKYELVLPKTEKSKRKIVVSNLVVEMLKKYKEEQETIIARLGDSYNNKGFIFTNVKSHQGLPILTKLVENRMTRLLKLANLNTKLSPHSLRHTHTSLLAAAGVELEDIKDRLGHFDDAITRKIYLHVTDPVKKEASDKFDNFMESA
ncbi:site-specific integrase [Anaerobacillus arseniciselenatis]|uniref:Site-specific integrase n=1 Tax=Anaerobacillus arseniciselenatis TaxID=85682 RepID=A0A1S2LUK6_9BACI|nr:tyrosine-type recombinase/integrase [Anaerobacillus arseniciselenatis]OIJ16211.1 site-specific integrase [Anaerobacillus arseniciselenatis]